MKQKNLLLNWWLMFLVFGMVGTISTNAQTLKHSYTFEDGTFDATTVFDQVATGAVNGTLSGTTGVTIAGGKCTVDAAAASAGQNYGYIAFDGTALGLASYSSITFEAYVTAGNGLNDWYTMLYYFGDNGWNFVYQQLTEGDWGTVLKCQSDPSVAWAYRDGVVDDDAMHHIVAVVNETELKYYLDGFLIATGGMGTANVSQIGTQFAHLFRGPDTWNDDNWIGSIDEFNIYEGEMDLLTVVNHTNDYLGINIDVTDATLSSITSSLGTLDPVFDPATDYYEVMVPYGSTSVDMDWTTTVSGATVELLDGLGNTMSSDGVVSWTADGIDLEFVVTALDGTTQMSYYVSVFLDPAAENANLSNITLTTGHLTSTFDPAVTEYVAIVPFGTASVDVTGVPAWELADVQGDGTVTLTNGEGSATITVTSEDMSATKVYTLTVYESAFQSGVDYYLVQEAGSNVANATGGDGSIIALATPLKNQNSQIWQFVESGVANQYFIMNADGSYMTLSAPEPNYNMEMTSTLNADLDSCRFTVEEIGPGRFYIRSLKRSLSTTPNNCLVSPNWSAVGERIYSDKWIGSGWDNDGQTVWNLTIPADMFPVDAYLSALSIDGATLSPSFSPNISEYDVVLDPGTTSITINATAEDGTYIVTGAGSIDLTEMSGTLVVNVKSPDDMYSKDYTINYIVDTPLTLMHAYTFEDGTAQDKVGDLDGLIMGGTITNGLYSTAADGDYIELSGPDLAINTYPSVTLEAYVRTGVNDGWTMLSYFGAEGGWPSYWMSIAGQTDQARAVVDVGDGQKTAAGVEPGAGEMHHYVSVLTNDEIKFYVDGILVQTTQTGIVTKISGISTDKAWLCYGGYHDPSWIGDIYEFNIYSGQMDALTIYDNYANGVFPEETETTDATLSDLTVNGMTIDGFHPAVLNYTIQATSTPVIDGTVKVSGAAYQVNAAAGVPGVATVVVTAADGVTKVTYTITIDTTTGVGDVEDKASIQVYPTVSGGEFTVEAEGATTLITVFNLAGSIVKQVQTNATIEKVTIDQNGLYIIKVESDGVTELFKVIKKD